MRDGMNWYAYCAGNPVGFVDPNGTDAILINKLVDNIASQVNVEHMSAFFQDKDGTWYYFFWGDSVQNIRITDASILENLDSMNQYLLDNEIINRADRQYRDAVYIAGDFSASVDAANVLVSDYEKAIADSDSSFNPDYNLFVRNCTQVTMELFYKGTLPSGNSVKDVARRNGYSISPVPNFNMNNMQNLFFNRGITFSEFNQAINRRRALYNGKDELAQFKYRETKERILDIMGY